MKRRFFHTLLLITLLTSLVFGVSPLAQPSQVLANPDIENLWADGSTASGGLIETNPTFAQGSTTGNFADASGKWAKTTYESWTFTMDNSAVGTGTINSVTLYLQHYQSGWTDDNYNIDVYDGSTWNTVQAYTSGGTTPPTGDTPDNWTVAALDTWAEIDLAQVRIIGNGQSNPEDIVQWFVDTVELRVDYTPVAAPDIANTPTSYGFGQIAESSTTATGLTHFTVTNNSAFSINIAITGTSMTGGTTWTLNDTATPGSDTYGLKAGLEGGSYNIIVKNSAGNTLVAGLASSGTQRWGLQLLAPTAFTGGGANSGTITLTATQV